MAALWGRGGLHDSQKAAVILSGGGGAPQGPFTPGAVTSIPAVRAQDGPRSAAGNPAAAQGGAGASGIRHLGGPFGRG